MKALLARIHARVGDLWWYSAMIFVACRCGDVTTALSAYKNRYLFLNEIGGMRDGYPWYNIRQMSEDRDLQTPA